MKTYDIALLGGDGTGPEVARGRRQSLRSRGQEIRLQNQLASTTISAANAISRPAKCCRTARWTNCASSRRFILGAVGHPQVKPGILEKGILLRLRFELEQYINLRPVKLYRAQDCPLKDKGPEHVDFIGHPREHRGALRRRGRFSIQGHAARSRHPGIRQHPPRRRALLEIRL